MQTIDNQQKYENYKEQSTRLKKALTAGFYLEAVFIEYAIIEDRCESILRHSNVAVEKDKYRGLNAKLKKICKMIEEKRGLPRKYFKQELIDEISSWKGKRNDLIHALMKQTLSTEGLKDVAEQGAILVKRLCTASTSYRRKIALIASSTH